MLNKCIGVFWAGKPIVIPILIGPAFSDVSPCAICALCGGKSGWGCVSWPPPGAICEMGVQDWAMPALQTWAAMANDRPRNGVAGAGGPTHDPRPLFLPTQRQCISTQTQKEDTNTQKEDTNTQKEDTNTQKEDTNTQKEDTNTQKANTNERQKNTG